MKSATLFILTILYCSSIQAEIIYLPNLGSSNPQLDIVSPGDGGVLDSGTISDATLIYDNGNGEGSFDLLASLGLIGDMQLHSTTITTNSDGSLAFDGLISFGMVPSTSYHYFGNLAVDYNYDSDSDVVDFTFSPIALPGLAYDGFFMPDGPFAGHLIDFEIHLYLLAYVDNPFPVYSPVPAPAALWLFASGLTLFGFKIKHRLQ